VMRISVTDTDAHRAQLLASRAGTAAVHIIEDLEKVKGRDFALLRARVVTDATTPVEVPGEAAAPGWRNPALGAAGGLLLGMALAVALSRLDPRVGDAEAVEELLGIPVLGVLPGSGSRTPRWAPRPRTEGWEDSVRRLRTNIFFHHPGPERCLTLALTAPHRVGELPRIGGAVAAALADTGGNVLLVEADLDEPPDARVFDQYADSSSGLSAYLAGESTEEEAVQHDHASGLDVVAAGDPPGNGADLLHSQAFATLMENAAKRYDFVMVNTPAMSVGTDAAAVAARCDRALLVAVLGRTREAQLLDAREQLLRVDASLLGVVLLS
jgi:capsular exopolysaccharide synthesis family protein